MVSINFKIGDYLGKKIDSEKVTRKDIYEQIQKTFYPDKEFIKYKAFNARFYYSRLYAEDLLEISYLLGIDLNDMRDTLMSSIKNGDYNKVEKALKLSENEKKLRESISKWICVEDEFVYIVWFKTDGVDFFDTKVEVYNSVSEEIKDISYLTPLAVSNIYSDWESKTFIERLRAIIDANKSFYKEKCTVSA